MIKQLYTFLHNTGFEFFSGITEFLFNGIARGNWLIRQNPAALIDLADEGNKRARHYICYGYYKGEFGLGKDLNILQLMHDSGWEEASMYVHIAEQEALKDERAKMVARISRNHRIMSVFGSEEGGKIVVILNELDRKPKDLL